MGAAAPQAPVGGWGPGPPQKFGHGPSLLVRIKFYNNFRLNPSPPTLNKLKILHIQVINRNKVSIWASVNSKN